MSEVKDLYDGKYHLVNNEILKYLNKFFGSFSPLSIGGETPEGVDIEPPMEIVKTIETNYGNCKCTNESNRFEYEIPSTRSNGC